MKYYAHDENSYYKAFLVEHPNNPNYKRASNHLYQLQKYKVLMSESKDSDVLGRRKKYYNIGGAEFYRAKGLIKFEPSIQTGIEKKHMAHIKLTPAGA